MELKNPLYKNIGIHVVSSIFTVDKGIVKVLLVKRTNEPFNGYYALPGGGLYNNELVLDGAKRELREKTGVSNVDLSMYKIFDRIDRSPLKRMIAIAFIGVVDKNKAQLISKSNKTTDIDWFDIRNIPELEFIYDESIEYGNKIEKIIEEIHNEE